MDNIPVILGEDGTFVLDKKIISEMIDSKIAGLKEEIAALKAQISKQHG